MPQQVGQQRIVTHDKTITLIIGAGSTYADTEGLSDRSPLNHGFFSASNKTHPKIVNKINSYMTDHYGIDIRCSDEDFLEKVMVCLYTDISNDELRSHALEAFQDLVSLYKKRIAQTTNNIPLTENLLLYRLIDHYLSSGFKPDNISIITFNHDLQIEKTLYSIARSEKWKNNGIIYHFPSMYMAGFKRDNVTAPSNIDQDLFDLHHEETGGIKVLKLHGSLNWYSRHNSERLSPKAMFNPQRKIWVTRRHTVDPSMKQRGSQGKKFTFPIITPPVINKSAIFHDKQKTIWQCAETILKNSVELTIFGYSCPSTDYESLNLFTRSLRNNENLQKISIIDPNSDVTKHYIDSLHLKKANFYRSAQDFLIQGEIL